MGSALVSMTPTRSNPLRAALLACALAPSAAGAQSARDAGLADSARAALADGRIEPAIRFAERNASRNFRNAGAWLLLGDAYFRRMPAGRFQALRAYEEAIRRAPRDPEPHYRYAQVGIWLGGDDGEQIARRGLEHAMAIDPLYHQAWRQWMLLFRSPRSRRHLRDLLEPFDSIPAVRMRMALLDIEDELYPLADSALDRLIEMDSTDPAWLALRAQSAFEAGDVARGIAFYGRAVAHAESDTGNLLWSQVVGIARPDELRAWDAVAPHDRTNFLLSFWARRNPDLFDGMNVRIGEHFRRLRYARRNYQLQHPLVTYHRSQLARALNLEPARGERDFYQRCEMVEVATPLPERFLRLNGQDTALAALMGRVGGMDQERATAHGVPGRAAGGGRDASRMSMGGFNGLTDDEAARLRLGFFDRTIFVPLNMDLRSVDTAAARVGYNLATGLDDRGITYLRFGAPGGQVQGGRNSTDPRCTTLDVELWHFESIGDVRFARPSAFSTGLRTVSEMVFRSMNERQFDAMKAAFTRDESSLPAPLSFGVWTAQFAGAQPGMTEIAVVSTVGQVAATIASADGRPSPVRRAATGAVLIDTRPGRATLIAHARDSGQLGRQELAIEARRFTAAPAMSDLLLAPAWTASVVGRWDMLRRVRRDLVFREGEPMRAYAEVYGLTADAGVVRYTASYTLLRTTQPDRDWTREQWPGAIQLRFDREAALPEGTNAARDVVDITPERLPPGIYLIRLETFDRVAQRPVGRAQIRFEVR